MKALIVDDNLLNIKVSEKLLEHLGVKVSSVMSGQECLENVVNNKYDIIFMDIMMPEMDGVETFKKLKILTYKKIGSVATLIIDEEGNGSRSFLESLNPIILDYLPLTLEEVFIYQMEALGYEFESVL